MNLIAHQITRHWRLAYIGFAALIAILYDVFFWDKLVGISFLIFVGIFVLGFIILSILTRTFRHPMALLLLVPIFVVSFDVAWYHNDVVVNTGSLFVVALLVVFSSLLTFHNPHRHSFSFGKIPLFDSIGLSFFEWNTMARDIFGSGQHNRQILKRIAIALAIAIPILFLFGVLFYSADEIFAAWIRSINIEAIDLWRIVRTVAMTLFVGSIFYVFIHPEYALKEKIWNIKKADALIAIIVLLLVNVLFAVFVFIQFKYLFGTAAYVFGNNVSFAEYARKGFFELVWVMVFASALLFIVYRFFSFSKGKRFVDVLQVILIAQIAIIACSALKRMNLYQDQFGFTVKRLYVEWYIYTTLATLLWAGIGVLFTLHFRKFFYGGLVLWTVACAGILSYNVDYAIAKENIDRFAAGKRELDVDYLAKLSPDILPSFNAFLQQGVLIGDNGWDNDRIRSLQNAMASAQDALAERNIWFEKKLRTDMLSEKAQQWETYFLERLQPEPAMSGTPSQ